MFRSKSRMPDPMMLQIEEQLNLEMMSINCRVCNDVGYVPSVYIKKEFPDKFFYSYKRCNCNCEVSPRVQEWVDRTQ